MAQIVVLFAVVFSVVVASAADTCRQVYFPDFSRPSFRLQPRAKDSNQIRVMSYNVENLFARVGRHEWAEGNYKMKKVPNKMDEEKPQHEIDRIKNIILENAPDILIAQEVESQAALSRLIDDPRFNGKYKAHLIEGNDPRGIDVGFLVRSDLPYEMRMETHKDVEWTDPVDNEVKKLFTRDVPAVFLTKPGATKPSLIVLGNHLKSMRDRPGDKKSLIWKNAQVEKLSEIIQGYQAKYGSDVAIVVGGDFNLETRSQKDLGELAKVTESAFDLDSTPVSPEQRITHIYFPPRGEPHHSQMDDLRVTKALAGRVIESAVIWYKDLFGKLYPLPQTFNQRSKQPSDHQPIQIDLNLQGL